ncbi:MAG: GNAT family N-acetyltransferase [Bacillota bacterium]
MTANQRVRPAEPGDIPAIVRVYRSDLIDGSWWHFVRNQRSPAHGGDLTPFEQWLNGGPWMNPDYLAVHLRRLAAEGHRAFVAEEYTPGTGLGAGWAVRGEVEVFLFREAARADAGAGADPGHLAAHIGVLQIERGFFRRGLGLALVERACREAAASGARKVTVVSGRDNLPFYRKCGFSGLAPVVTVEGGLPRTREAAPPPLSAPPEGLFARGVWPSVAGVHPGPGQTWFLYRAHPYVDPEFTAHRLEVSTLDLPAATGRGLRRAVAFFRENQIDSSEVIVYCLAEPDGAGPDPSFSPLGRAALAELQRWAASLGYTRFRTYLTGPEFSRLRFFFRMSEVSREYILRRFPTKLEVPADEQA